MYRNASTRHSEKTPHSRGCSPVTVAARASITGVDEDAGSYPVLVYSVVSDVPALSADGEEIERRVTVRVHILTKDGAADAIEDCVMKRMMGLGFRRAQSVEFAEKNMFVKAIDFRIGTGVEA